VSVEITGPKGYEWQYRITSLIALQNLQSESLVVESADGEDAQLLISEPEAIHTVDIQAKSSQADIDASILCGWLTHFGRQHSTDALLSRLLADGGRVVVFVSAGRCGDSTRPLIRKLGNIQPHQDVPKEVSRAILNALCHLSSVISANPKLQRARRDHIATLIETFERKIAILISALRRVVLWESTTTDEIDHRLSMILTQRHRVPLLSCVDVLHQLDAAVRSARDNRADVLPGVRSVLAERSARAMLGDEPHISTNQENSLLSTLKQTRVLLLTGRSQCGKTNMAKYLAQVMQGEGVNAELGQDPSQAWRFLSAQHEEPRLFLLEDPFDEMRSSTETLRPVETLRRIVKELRQHRFLIVTSKLNTILPPHAWHDLTVRDSMFLIRYWQTICADSQMLVSLQSTLEDGLKEQDEDQLLQPGHLLYLSRLPDIQDLPFERLSQLARFDIVPLAHALSDRTPVSRVVHIGLCLGASTVQRMPTDELAFVISETDVRPGFSESFVIFSFRAETPVFPTPPPVLALSTEVLHELSFLERSGHIRTTTKGIEFTHPDYLAASQEILGTCAAVALPRLLAMLDRGLASLNQATALLSTAILSFIYDRYGHDAAHREQVFEIAKHARDSILPAVREAILEVVLAWLPTLDVASRRQALSFVGVADFQYNEILWHGDIPSTSSSRSFLDLMVGPHPPRSGKDDALLNSLVDPHAVYAISPRQAWNLVHYIHANPGVPGEATALVELMKQPYAFIRAKAIRVLVERHTDQPTLYLQPLHAEQSPGVLLAAIHECMRSWHNACEASQQQLRAWLVASLSKAPVAVVCSDLLTDFGDPYSNHGPVWIDHSTEQRRDIWKLWATLFPVYLRAIASQPFEHNAPHMDHTLRVAPGHLEGQDLSEVVESWIMWIEGQLELRRLDDYELAVADLLLATAETDEKRTRCIERLLGHRDTGYVVTTVHYMVGKWNFLSEDERNLLREVLVGARPDSRWMRAVAITRKDVPPEIQLLLTGYEDLLSRPPRMITDSLSPDLLSDALHVHCGHPQPLWWYGLHHDTHTPWRAVLEFIVNEPMHRDFDLALRAFFFALNLGDETDVGGALDMWRNLCQRGDASVRQRLFDRLLSDSVEFNHPRTFGFWSILVEAASGEAEATTYTNGILDNFQAISQNVDNIGKFFGEPLFRDRLIPKLARENEFLQICEDLRRATTHNEKRSHMAHLEKILLRTPPRIFWLFDRIDPLLASTDLPEAESVRQAASKARDDFFAKARQQERALEDEVEIWDWTTSFRNNRMPLST
jgi:energy-coupling factor transporter ATP-binding protein EcfA2